MREGWLAEAGDVECVLFAQGTQHTIKRGAGLDDVRYNILVEMLEALTRQLAAFYLGGEIAWVLEYKAAVWHIVNVVVALELIGAPLYHRINALRYAADFALVVFPRQLKDTTLEYDVVIIIYCRKHALGMRGVVSSDLVGLHATKGGLWGTAGNRTGPVVFRLKELKPCTS